MKRVSPRSINSKKPIYNEAQYFLNINLPSYLNMACKTTINVWSVTFAIIGHTYKKNLGRLLQLHLNPPMKGFAVIFLVLEFHNNAIYRVTIMNNSFRVRFSSVTDNSADPHVGYFGYKSLQMQYMRTVPLSIY